MRLHPVNYDNDSTIYPGRKSEVLATVVFFFLFLCPDHGDLTPRELWAAIQDYIVLPYITKVPSSQRCKHTESIRTERKKYLCDSEDSHDISISV